MMYPARSLAAAQMNTLNTLLETRRVQKHPRRSYVETEPSFAFRVGLASHGSDVSNTG